MDSGLHRDWGQVMTYSKLIRCLRARLRLLADDRNHARRLSVHSVVGSLHLTSFRLLVAVLGQLMPLKLIRCLRAWLRLLFEDRFMRVLIVQFHIGSPRLSGASGWQSTFFLLHSGPMLIFK